MTLTIRERLRDVVESMGATCTIRSVPTHPEGRTRYPLVTVTLGRHTLTTHRATLALCAEDVTRWLQQQDR